jgi:predicted AAA+ superfamily ATPase
MQAKCIIARMNHVAVYRKRTMEAALRRAAGEFPSVVLTGPRQSGKTTLLRQMFGETHGYVSLEPPDVRAAASSDPRGFLKQFPAPVIFDEIQYAPSLLPYIKEILDASRSRKGLYLLTGSQNLMMMEHVTESLAGRTAILRLLPFSYREIAGKPMAGMPWEESGGREMCPLLSGLSLWQTMFRGGYPELWQDLARDVSLWYASYMQTYLERDVRQLRQVGDLTQFQSFLRALAARSAQLLDLTSLGRDLGIATNTVRAWLSVLEASYQVVIIRPYFANIGKRLVKTPKVYFTDVGLLCHLVGIRDAGHAMQGPMAGAIFETAMFAETIKRFWHSANDTPLHFWRTSTGVEVDMLVSRQQRLIPVEIKASSTPHPGMVGGLLAFQRDLPGEAEDGLLVHAGEIQLPLAPRVKAVPFGDF